MRERLRRLAGVHTGEEAGRLGGVLKILSREEVGFQCRTSRSGLMRGAVGTGPGSVPEPLAASQ